MRKIFLLLSVFFTSMLFSQSRGADIDTVLSEMNFQERSWNNGDIPGFMEYYWQSDSLRFISSGAVIYGWNTTIGRYLKSYPTKEAMGTLKFTIVEATQLSSESIFVIGKWELLKKKPASGYFTLLWRKINGKWVIVTDHTS